MRMPALLIVLLLAVIPSFARSGARKDSRSASGKSVHVRTYTRKDGTVVRGHDRAGSAAPAKAMPKPAPARKALAAPRAPRDSRGVIQRSEAAKGAFQRSHPCPSTGRTTGACKGYIVDHRTPLACGGADSPANMQWQTVAEARAKDKWERVGCR